MKLTRKIYSRFRYYDFAYYRERGRVTHMLARNTLIRIGPFLEKLRINGNSFITPCSRTIELIPKLCLDLRNVEIIGFPFTMKTIQVFTYLAEFESFHFILCSFTDDIQLFISFWRHINIHPKCTALSSLSDRVNLKLNYLSQKRIEKYLFQPEFFTLFHQYQFDTGIPREHITDHCRFYNKFTYLRNELGMEFSLH